MGNSSWEVKSDINIRYLCGGVLKRNRQGLKQVCVKTLGDENRPV